MHIILVDDHQLFSKSLEIALKGRVSRLDSFTDTERVPLFQLLAQIRPDILLLDVRLGRVNGLKLGQEILDLYPTLKIAFLSGFDVCEFHETARQMGAVGFLNKSQSIDSLLASLQAIMDGQTVYPANFGKRLHLTDAERQVLELTARGLKQQEIADTLDISRRTVNTHIQAIQQKFEVNSTVKAVALATEQGLITIN